MADCDDQPANSSAVKNEVEADAGAAAAVADPTPTSSLPLAGDKAPSSSSAVSNSVVEATNGFHSDSDLDSESEAASSEEAGRGGPVRQCRTGSPTSSNELLEQPALPIVSFTPSDSTAPESESERFQPAPEVSFSRNDSTEDDGSDELAKLPLEPSTLLSISTNIIDDYATSTYPLSPRSPSSPHASSPLLANLTTTRSSTFTSSPLNPNGRPVRSSSTSGHVSQTTSRVLSLSEESAAFAGSQTRGSMLLYRLASDEEKELLAVPVLPNRFSAASHSESMISFDTKYPSEKPRGLVPYVYDPELANEGPEDEVDKLHAAEDLPTSRISGRGFLNVGLLVFVMTAILCLFIFYPTWDAIVNGPRRLAQDQNININSTGQNADLPLLPNLVDSDTPDDAKTRVGFDGYNYNLVFSDEFNTDGRTFWPGDDPYWEAVDLWYGATQDLEWYDPQQAFTRDGYLVLLMENVETHGLNYRSGMIQSWNKFCFTNGYIEINLSLPGPDENTAGYWPGAWTMGNLGRPGYLATTDGTWPYSYDSCDVGTFPNQTYANGTGPAAAIDSDSGWSEYDYRLSWLTGQRASSCTCAGGDHPGPSVQKGRGAPEIDILEAQKNQVTGSGGKVSQSVQFAPFTSDYNFNNNTADEFDIYDSDETQVNGYKGSAVQQAVSALTDLPSDIFNGSGGKFYTFGFEYWTDPDHPEDGWILWQANGVQSVRVGAGAVSADPLPDGSGVSQRLISEEPLSIILNLGMSEGFQTIDLSTMTFPAEFHIDYVRVYQREGEQNIGCSPKNYPTADYIEAHAEAYSNPNLTSWEDAGFTRPLNSQYDGC